MAVCRTRGAIVLWKRGSAHAAIANIISAIGVLLAKFTYTEVLVSIAAAEGKHSGEQWRDSVHLMAG